MSTFDMLEKYVNDKCKPFSDFPPVVQKGINTIAGEIPFKLKLAITLSELITFSSHLRKSIKLFDNTLVPTNAIVFALSGSGTSKDKSLNAIRKSMHTAYTKLEAKRKEYAIEKAKVTSVVQGFTREDWQKYYIAPKPLQAGLGTVEGLHHHFADIVTNPLGAGSILSTEIGSDLQNNGAMADVIKNIAMGYDLGNLDAKIVKAAENQSGTIRGLPINALLFGSQSALLFDNVIKAKFKLIFNTQLARRSIFTFTPETPPKPVYKTIDDLYAIKEKERAVVLLAQQSLDDFTSDLVDVTTQEPLVITDDANKLFDVYLEYNSLKADMISSKYPISKLSRRHKQWLALKLAGSYAILDHQEAITQSTYAYAINTVEFLSEDLQKFEVELIKEPYEQLADVCLDGAEDGKFTMSLHDLRKMGYINGAGPSKGKIDELAKLVNSYDQEARYTANPDSISYQQTLKTDIIGFSCIIF
jgi:hypothetical protein